MNSGLHLTASALTPTCPQAFDQLATMVAVIDLSGQVLFVNASFESHLGLPRRSLLKHALAQWFTDPEKVQDTIDGVVDRHFSSSRLEAFLKRPLATGLVGTDVLPVLLSFSQMDDEQHVLVEVLELEHQSRQEREERTLDQALANKELIRNLAHEIKNPLGGIRGAAQLLEMELSEQKSLTEYTQVIIAEADRLQVLVDRLLAPHRRPHVEAPLNIHEVLERVRALVLAEFPRGLQVVRDYDTSLPEFPGDKEQLIQAVLNMVRNAAQMLAERIALGDACITLRTRVARNVTLGKRRHKLALDLHIEDNGPGIAPDLRERIFYPLVSGREGGSGLGLTLALTFVQQHQGTIECDSSPGQTTFKILIPLT